MSSLYTQSFPLLATGSNNINCKETAMTMIQQPTTVVSPPPPKKRRNKPGNSNPDAEVIALSPKTIRATNRYLCEVCNQGFNRKQNLELHGRVHNRPWKLKQKSAKEVRRKVYICPEPTCVHHHPSRALGDMTGIKKHYHRKHCEKLWKCENCSKSYALQSDLKIHSKMCGTKQSRCDYGTTFSRRDDYNAHKTLCDALNQDSERYPTVSFTEMAAAPGGSGSRHDFCGGAAFALGSQDFDGGAASALGRQDDASSALGRHGFYGGGAASALGRQDFYGDASSALGRHGFYGGSAASALGSQDFDGSAASALGRQDFYGGAASALSQNQFGNDSNTGITPLTAGYNLNRSSSKNFEDFVPQPTNPNPGPTNFLMQCSSNQGLLAQNDQTLRSHHDLISLGDRINNNNNSTNPGYFQNNTMNSNQALFTHGAANNDPSALLRGLTFSSSSLSSGVNGFGQNENGNLQGLVNSLPVTNNQQGWSGGNIFDPHFGNNLSMGGSDILPFDFGGVNGGIVSNGRNSTPLDTEMNFSYPNYPFGNPN